MFRPRAVPVSRYRYRGARILTPWASHDAGDMTIGMTCGEPDARRRARPVRRAGRGNGPAERLTPRPARPLHLPQNVGGLALPRPRSRMPTRVESSGGRWPITCAASWSSEPWRWLSAQRRPEPGLIHHSDQGSQFVSLGFGHAATKAGISRSRWDPRGCAGTTPSPRRSSRH